LFVPATKLRIFQQNPQFFPPIDHHHFFLVPVSSTANGFRFSCIYERSFIFLGFFSSMFFVGEEEMTVSQTMQNSKVLWMDVAGNSFFHSSLSGLHQHKAAHPSFPQLFFFVILSMDINLL
jgi:hypothetical protein